MALSKRSALFCDLTGTLVAFDERRELPLNSKGEIIIRVLPNVASKLNAIRRTTPIFVVTNQAGVARGRFTLDALERALLDLNCQLGGALTGWKVCPHQDADRCDCRKPKPGMILELAQQYDLDLSSSVMVGDQEIDAQCARAAGVGRFYYANEFFGFGR